MSLLKLNICWHSVQSVGAATINLAVSKSAVEEKVEAFLKKVQGTLESFVFLCKEVRKIFSCQILEKPARNWLIFIITQQQRTSFIWETKQKSSVSDLTKCCCFLGHFQTQRGEELLLSVKSLKNIAQWDICQARNLYWVIMARKILHCWLLLLSQQNYFPELL